MGAKLHKLKQSLHNVQRGLGPKAKTIAGVAAFSALTVLSTSCQNKTNFEQKSENYIEVSEDLQSLKEERVEAEQKKNELENEIKQLDTEIRAKTIEYNDAKRAMKDAARKE